MDFRKLGWKKKSSEKHGSSERQTTVSESSESLAALARQNDEQANKLEEALKTITERDEHLEETAQQIQELGEQNKNLNEKLSAALSEISVKENLVKQHAKVAEEAVSGWEKAEAEATASKQQVESLTQQKTALEDRVSHLDGALKECMKQMRLIKEEYDRKISETIINKNRECERIKFEYDSKFSVLDHRIIQGEAENAALTRSLQERTRELAEMHDLRAEAEAQVNVLQVNLEQYKKDNASLSFEIQLLNKSLEIRTEEKNISMKSADAANKQHLEDVKKIAKLEGECQRLRGLVRKKLPGPAALAQMRMEAEYVKELPEPRRRRSSPSRSSSPFVSSAFDSGYDYGHDHQGQKESAFLTERLLAMEEETKMLKEALAKRNSELQASRSVNSKSQSRISYLEKQLEAFSSDQKQRKSVLELSSEGPRSHTTSNPPSLTSMSEDGNDDEVSCTDSWATSSAVMSGLPQLKKDKGSGRNEKVNNEPEKFKLMDDFEEMERLASLPSTGMESSGGRSDTSGEKNKGESDDRVAFVKILATKDSELQAAIRQCSELSKKLDSVQQKLTAMQLNSAKNETALAILRRKLDSIFEACTSTNDAEQVILTVKSAMKESSIVHGTSTDVTKLPETLTSYQDGSIDAKGESFGPGHKIQINMTDADMDGALSRVVSLIHSISREIQSSRKFPAYKVQNMQTNVEKFSRTVNDFFHGNLTSVSFVNEFSSLLGEISELCKSVLGENKDSGNDNGSMCALTDTGSVRSHENGNAESKVKNDENAEVKIKTLQAEKVCLESELQAELSKSKGVDEKLLEVCRERDELKLELTTHEDKVKDLNNQVKEMEETVEKLQHELASVQNSRHLAQSQSETLISLKSDLESQLKRIELEKTSLHEKIESLMSELEEERKHQEEADANHRVLIEQLERKEEELALSRAVAAENEMKAKQDREIAAAAEKLAECQRTIDFLGRQLHSLRSPKDSGDMSNYNENMMQTSSSVPLEDASYRTPRHPKHHQAEESSNFSTPTRDNNNNVRSTSNSRSASVGSESDIPYHRNRRQKSGLSSGRSAIADSHSNRDNTGHSRRPSSSDTEASSPAKSPPSTTRSTGQRNRIPRSMAGNSLSRSLNMGESKPSCEKSGGGIGRFFSRKCAH